jgi:hypothetical protein
VASKQTQKKTGTTETQIFVFAHKEGSGSQKITIKNGRITIFSKLFANTRSRNLIFEERGLNFT